MGFFDSLTSGLSRISESGFGSALGGALGTGLGAFAQGAGLQLAQNIFGKGTAAGAPFGLTPFGGGVPFGFGQQFGGAGLQFGPQQFQFGQPRQQFPQFGQTQPGFGQFRGLPQLPFLQQQQPASQPFAFPPVQQQQFPTAIGAGFTPLGGAFGGQMGAFPTTRFQGFPASPFAQQASLLGGFDIPGFDLVNPFAPQGSAAAGARGGVAVGGTPLFRLGMAGARAQFFRTPNPVTGQDTWFRPAGRPVLWSGDLTACKRVNKVARRARRKR